MNIKRKIKRGLIVTVGLFALMSLSVLLLPFVRTDGRRGTDVFQFVIGILFWAGLLAGSISYFYLYRKYRNMIVTELPDPGLPGFFRFFSGPAAAVTDGVLILGIIGAVYASVARTFEGILDLVSLFLVVTSLYLHALANGRLFRYVSQSRKRGVKEK